MGLNTTYKAKSFDLSDLTGISNETLAMHFKLYEGYVTNTNTLNERIAELIKGGELDATKTAAFSELKRLGRIDNGDLRDQILARHGRSRTGGI